MATANPDDDRSFVTGGGVPGLKAIKFNESLIPPLRTVFQGISGLSLPGYQLVTASG